MEYNEKNPGKKGKPNERKPKAPEGSSQRHPARYVGRGSSEPAGRQKISESPATEKYTLGQRSADAIARFAGSWAFIFAFTGVLILWMVINTILASNAFDPYPFILLNLVLSCVAAIQAPLIMMSQNRQEEKDRRRAENDYKVNLKTEIMIEDLYDKVNAILAKQSALEKKLQEQEETKS